MSDDAAPVAPADSGPLTMLIPAIEATGAMSLPSATAQTRRPRKRGKVMRVDWPACKAHGLCHERFPERIQRDEWGYPIVDSGVLRGKELDLAKTAVKACPTLALRLIDPTGR